VFASNPIIVAEEAEWVSVLAPPRNRDPIVMPPQPLALRGRSSATKGFLFLTAIGEVLLGEQDDHFLRDGGRPKGERSQWWK
jgi:hypothetical protein